MAASAAGDLRLLGGWRLEVDRARWNPPPAAQRLIALVGLRGPQPRHQVSALLFPGQEPRRAGARLRDLISRTIRPWQQSGLLCTGETLALSPRVGVDVHRLAETIADLDAGREEALGRLPWEVDLLPGWNESWVVEDRERLRRDILRSLAEFGEDRLRVHDAAWGLIAAELAGRLDPLNERAARRRMRAHLTAGDPALAVRVFRTLRRALREDLGVEPEPATVELARSCLAGGCAAGPLSRGR